MEAKRALRKTPRRERGEKKYAACSRQEQAREESLEWSRQIFSSQFYSFSLPPSSFFFTFLSFVFGTKIDHEHRSRSLAE